VTGLSFTPSVCEYTSMFIYIVTKTRSRTRCHILVYEIGYFPPRVLCTTRYIAGRGTFLFIRVGATVLIFAVTFEKMF
jgi:hypothetical protein